MPLLEPVSYVLVSHVDHRRGHRRNGKSVVPRDGSEKHWANRLASDDARATHDTVARGFLSEGMI